MISGPFPREKSGRTPEWVAGAGDSSFDNDELNSDSLARPSEAAEPLLVGHRKPFETLEFREPYRIRGVQSFGD